MRTHKYNACRTTLTVCGETRTFASKREAFRWRELKLLERAGEISGLRCQSEWPLLARCLSGASIELAVYRDDFSYRQGNELVVEDAKGYRTPLYKLKKKWAEACHNITITEV